MSAINKAMDPKTKQLVERAEALLLSEYDVYRPDDELIKALCSAVREQDKRARHAEAERDTFSKRIDELKAQRHAIIQACLGRDVKDALASQVLGLWKSQSKLTEYAAELEAERNGLSREIEAKAAMIENLAAKCEALEAQSGRVRDLVIGIADDWILTAQRANVGPGYADGLGSCAKQLRSEIERLSAQPSPR